MATPKKVDTKKGAPIVRMHDEDDADRIGNPASDEIDEDLTATTEEDPSVDPDEKE
ncbi:MAG: hypothetical protein IPI07_02200 [Flavobacteriales bacterium]|nr:hypothetical protein [Flavobacteriales bacterium]